MNKIRKELLYLLLFIAYSCGNDKEETLGGTTNERSNFQEEINAYVSELPSVEQTSPFKERKFDDNLHKSVLLSRLSSPISRTSSIESFYEQAKEFEEQLLFSDDKNVFYPGALLNAKSVLQGEYNVIITERQPIIISTDLQGKGDPTITILNPSLSNVRKGINELLGREFNPPAANLTYSIEEVYDKTHLKIAMGGNYKGAANTVEASTGFNFDKEMNRFLVKVQQIFYELSIDAPQKPSDFFNKEFDYKGEFGEDKPLYVSSVKYGRILLLGIETKMSKKEAEVKLQASILGGRLGVNAETAYDDLIKESTIKGRVLGGNAKLGSIATIGLDQVKQFIEEGAKLSVENPGAPIAYKLKELGTNKTFKTVIYSKYTKNDPYAGEFSQISFDLIIPDDLRTLSGEQIGAGKGYIRFGEDENRKKEFYFDWHHGYNRSLIPSYRSNEKIYIIFDRKGWGADFINEEYIFELPMFETLVRESKKMQGSNIIFDEKKNPLRLRDITGSVVIGLGIQNVKFEK